MKVTTSMNFIASYDHINGTHDYVKTIVKATCEHEGYELYTCQVCGESYKENIKPKLEHQYSDWVVVTNPRCETNGLEQHHCTLCNNVEEREIEALGHNYKGIIIKEATCEHEGIIEYTCETCNEKVKEVVPLKEHDYVKIVVPKSWLRVLIESLLNLFFGYEGTNGYYYRYKECHHIMTNDDKTTVSSSGTSSICNHIEGDWKLVSEASCVDGIEGRYCELCNNLVEARVIEATGIHKPSDWIIDVNPTCTTEGSKHTECTVCGEELERATIEKRGCNSSNAFIQVFSFIAMTGFVLLIRKKRNC